MFDFVGPGLESWFYFMYTLHCTNTCAYRSHIGGGAFPIFASRQRGNEWGETSQTFVYALFVLLSCPSSSFGIDKDTIHK